jgi:uncharacterized protein YggE
MNVVTRASLAIVMLAAVSTAAQAQTPLAITSTGRGIATVAVTTAFVKVDTVGIDDQTDFRNALSGAGVDGIIVDPTPDVDYGGSFDSKFVAFRGRILNAAPARLRDAQSAISSFAGGHPSMGVIRITFYGPSTACAEIEQRARDAAFTDARHRGEEIAAENHEHLGAQLAATETGGCPPPGPFGGAFAIDAATMIMRVPVAETVTYAALK